MRAHQPAAATAASVFVTNRCTKPLKRRGIKETAPTAAPERPRSPKLSPTPTHCALRESRVPMQQLVGTHATPFLVFIFSYARPVSIVVVPGACAPGRDSFGDKKK